jgi:hypothetical protein
VKGSDAELYGSTFTSAVGYRADLVRGLSIRARTVEPLKNVSRMPAMSTPELSAEVTMDLRLAVNICLIYRVCHISGTDGILMRLTARQRRIVGNVCGWDVCNMQ